MTEHKVGETRAERKIRRIIEHHKKVATEYHLNYDKMLENEKKEIGEHARRITSTFSDKEMEEAMKIGFLIAERQEPEDGLSYKEIALILWDDGDYIKNHPDDVLNEKAIKERYRNDYIQRVDRLLYVLQYIYLEFMYNTTLEPNEKGKRYLSMMPCVRSTRKLRVDGKIITYNEPVRVIFNGFKRKYAAEQMLKIVEADKTKLKTVTELPSNEDVEAEFIMNNLKGDISNAAYLEELSQIVWKVRKIMKKCKDQKGIEETELMHKVFPESMRKSGKDLEPYVTKFNDALYLFFKAFEPKTGELNRQWKIDHGYLEGA